MWSQLSEALIELKESQTFDVKLLKDSLDNKTKELNCLVKDIKKCKHELKKVELESQTVEKAIIKANSNIAKAENKCCDLQDYINKMAKKSDENKENVENVMNVWNTIGLRVEKKDQFLNVKFNKISANDPNKWFSVKIKLENDSHIEIVESEPKDCLDSKLIEEKFNDKTDDLNDSKIDLRFLIAFIRNNLMKNNSN